MSGSLMMVMSPSREARVNVRLLSNTLSSPMETRKTCEVAPGVKTRTEELTLKSRPANR